MEAQLEEVVRKIKTDGVESARQEAADIIAQAKEESNRIMAQAAEAGKETLARAEAEVQQLRQTVEDSLKQAARDLVLAVRKELEELFRKLLEREVAASFSGPGLEKIILELMKGWSGGSAIDLQVSEKDVESIAGTLLAKLKEQMGDENFAIKPLDNMKTGLRISYRDGTAYFDFTDEEISKTLAQLLNPKFASFLN